MSEDQKKALTLVLVTSHIHPHGRGRTELVNALDFLHGKRGIYALVVRSIESAPDHDALEWANGSGVPALIVPENWRNGPEAPARQADEVTRKANAAMHWAEEPFDRSNSALVEALRRKEIRLWVPEPNVYGKAWSAHSNDAPEAPKPKEGWDD